MGCFSSKYICSIYEYVGFTSNDLSSLIIPYPATAFPHIVDTDIQSIDGEDIVKITNH